ncbi:SAM-dependent methyltransferase [Agrobacterium vitis]|nr:SAM-dependent methyltransferase [Agrobacterium vitis]MBE1439929.1 SAM-dependent methyltransferase [Agrobacterium vitis]
MSRIYQDLATIDASQVKAFFNDRAKKETDAVNAVMLQSAGSTLANDRDAYEKNHLVPKLTQQSRILEFGCGAGRLASTYDKDGHKYLGLDFSEELIAIAKAQTWTEGNIHFQVAEVPVIDVDKLPLQPPFDFFIVTGLLIYLNDDAVRDTFALIARLAAPQARLYLRESISDMETRLTLKEYYSEELGEVYNAIYRTPAELKAIMDDILVPCGFSYSVCGDYAFPPALRNRAETAQRYFILNR